MAYPRKGSITLAQAKSLLSIDPVFNTLSSADKTVFINVAAQKVCNLRNQNNKEDYSAFTAAADIITDQIISTGGVIKGTSVERIAYGAGLDANSQIIWIDTTENTVYGWNGTEWV